METTNVSHLKVEIARMNRVSERLRTDKQDLSDEIRALKSKVSSYEAELESLKGKVQTLEAQGLQETVAGEIGKQVRLRYLECYRRRMGKAIGNFGYDRIKRGDRAAHRGRPVADALLCLMGEMKDPDVYKDLYGVDPELMRHCKDVPGVVEIAGFRASLQSEGRLTKEFQTLFDRMIKVARNYASPTELKAAFTQNKAIQQLEDEIKGCYDGIVNTDPRGQRKSPSQEQKSSSQDQKASSWEQKSYSWEQKSSSQEQKSSSWAEWASSQND